MDEHRIRHYFQKFVGADRFWTTSKGGPCADDIHSRRTWSLSTGKLLDECVIDDTPDRLLCRPLPCKDDIRVELTLKNAEALYMRKGPDVSEMFSVPRICQEASARRFGGQTLTPGWSLDLTMLDPTTNRAWDLSRADVQDRVRTLVRTTKPYFIIGSPPCTAFSPLQEISRKKRDPKVMAKQIESGKRHIRFVLRCTLCR